MNWSTFIGALKKYDFSFFGISCALFAVGVLNLYSATHSSEHMTGLYKAQTAWFLLSLAVGAGVSLVHPKNFFRYSWAIYAAALLLLVLVLLFGQKGMGAQRWISFGPVRMQPSEIAKVALVLVLGRWFARKEAAEGLDLRGFVVPFAITAVPVVLIAMGPDLGTGSLLLLTFLAVAFYRKLKWRTVGLLAVLGTIGCLVIYETALEDYQRDRIMTFLNPGQDRRGSGYNAIQSRIAIGSGQFLGKGFMRSTQASLQYLPENHTDFVFSVFSEEHGFLGCLVVIVLYSVLIFRFLWLADAAPRMFESTVVVGVAAVFFWQVFINMSMVMGMMPIVGLPLPYMSYGGSSLMAFGICCGVATSISNSRRFF